MIYICPTFNKEFDIEDKISKHFLQCWKKDNPHHKSKPAPRSENITTTKMSDDMTNFFASLEGDREECTK